MNTKHLDIESPLGTIRLVAGGGALAGIYLETQPRDTAGDGPEDRTDPVLAGAARQLAEYFAGSRRAFALPLTARGTAFQRAVWSALAAIPFGETRTYGELAEALGRPSAVRAVGGANARNPLSIVVPCHRVVGGDGSLTGYAGGLAAKEWLLAHERGA